MGVPGYRVVEELSRTLRRAVRIADGAPVLLTSSRHGESRRELALLASLAIPGIPKAYDVVRDGEASWLVLEDRGGEPLSALLGGGPLDVATVLHFGLELGAILGGLHRRGYVHHHVRPACILVKRGSRELSLLDFAHATSGAASTPALRPETLAYVSPEQTGRTSRIIDERTDLYSLGLTLYEALTGIPAFRSTDALELIHAQIARTPDAPRHVRPEVPEPLSAIVMKLLEKSADDRYQSAAGLHADLDTCARAWSSLREIPAFPLGRHDVTDRFLVPQKLYGRERDVLALRRAFEAVCQGPPAMVLVSGWAGIGKTSLIQELYRPIVRQRGAFISGKFDQSARNIPFGALVQAFRGLVLQLLTESEERLAERRQRLEAALGESAAVLIDVIPEIELIVGKKPAAPPLAAVEAQNRFRMAFQNFVGALAGPEHPLVVFLDDLQWADAASLDLLQPLLTSADVRALLVIGAYRDNEVDAGHPLTRAIAGLSASAVPIDRIVLSPLTLPDLHRLVADCLKRDDPEVEELARLVARKTEGNPFFVIQFLKSLGQDGLLRFDAEEARWVFRVDDIARAPMTQNVIDLMDRKIQRLSSPAQETLTLAACIGNRFDLGTLATVSRETPEAVASCLQEALDEGLVLRDPDADTYAFLHDHVQHAAYARLPDGERAGLHLTLGRLLRASWGRAAEDERIFDVVGHLNVGRSLIVDEGERFDLARLNRIAGDRAKSSTAYQAALEHFRTSRQLLGEDQWATDGPFTFAVHLGAAECEYLCGHFDEAERRFEHLLARARTMVDKARVYELRVVQHENMSRYAEAARIGFAGCALFGMEFPEDPDAVAAMLEGEMAAIERLLDGRPIASLVDLSVLDDAETRMLLKLLTTTWAPAYILGNARGASLISARIVRLSIERGNSEDSAYGYVTHAITVGPHRGDYRSAYDWGALALAVNDRFADQSRRSKIHQQFNAHVTLWRRPLHTCIPHAREACRSGLEYGDFAYAGYGAFTESWPAFLTSGDLGAFVRDYVPTLAVLAKVRMHGLVDAHTVMLQWARALLGETDGPCSLSGPGFDEAAYVARHRENRFFMTVLRIAQLHLAVVHGDVPAALAAAREARALGPWGRGTIWPVLLEYWGGLAIASGYDGSRPLDAGDARALEAARETLEALAASCPENFLCFHLTLDAEARRIAGDRAGATTLYESALQAARRYDAVQHEALAHDLASRAFAAAGLPTAAHAHREEARRAYRAWGAVSKAGSAAAVAEVQGVTIDVASVVKAAHALSGEIVLEELLRKLMSIAIENAGAERGVFLEEKDGRLVVEAEGRVGGEAVRVLESRPLEEADVCRAVVQFVRKTGEGVVVADVGKDERFGGDPYVVARSPKSVLSVPVVRQGRLGGILYLENNLTAGAFTAERIRILDLLSAQAAISLENARLYRDRTQEVERRKRAEDDLRAALGEVETLKNRLEAENVYLQEEIRKEHNFEEMVGSSPQLLSVLRTVERIAPTDSTVLIYGETGTGKELIARAIHDRSARKGRPLVKVNCGAIAAGLVESELFGHVRGAFTGAIENRVGRFELARGGTIFLDEVGELPPETQTKLLRVLQEHEFEPVGGSRTVRVDVRVLAATNRDLEEAMRGGRFRPDLYYRLNVVPLTAPPLRERKGDIPQLVAFFLERFSRRFGKAVNGVSQETMERLIRYRWPGNIRELQNVIERAVVLMPGSVLTLDHELNPAPGFQLDRPMEPLPQAPTGGEAPALEDVQRRHIIEVLERTRGVIEGEAGAAKILKLHPNTLRSKMKKLGIRRATHDIS
ncbi:MAG TPA: sigma 54-interacting transcriptional regulator [Candidatus Polarisedimenticolaceae bacterium]|nr:sigma 54-interacting transcriptional regulator [Candidatus Polarisedimenticolaceae bacterium]